MSVQAKRTTPGEFRNEPLTDFSDAATREAFQKALQEVRADFGKEFPLFLGGERVTLETRFESRNPARRDEVVGIFQKADQEAAERAMSAALQAFEGWKSVDPAQRADYLFRGAARMRERKHFFSATMVLEVGKSWPEADADTAEAIDFMEFYAREMLRYADTQPVTPIPGEENELIYIPLGVGVVIPPWNFPLAILVGMTTAAIVTGNTVILKPSSDSPLTGFRFAEMMNEELGLPAGVLNLLTGPGSIAGDYLVQHPKTRFVSFTGSKDVGLGINEKAARTAPGQIWIKRVVAEMGGKDSIVVDSDCDLDAAVEGVLKSAFGYQGQKCSACSRAIVHEKIYDEFLEKLTEKTRSIKMGEPEDPSVFMGPVINEAAATSILDYIEKGKNEGRLVVGGEKGPEGGHFVQPTIIADVPPKAVISLEEIFGPVLAVIKAKDYDDALEIANNTEYGLTGSVYTNDEAKMAKARKTFHVGNLYFNRKCTGALVGGHPFGGFNMSGTDSKAGGRDYLGLFLQAKAMSRTVK
jgi:1-pyrroline-5-carboxylate dehydrogenase